MKKSSTIDKFFKRKEAECSKANVSDIPSPASDTPSPASNVEVLNPENPSTKIQRVRSNEIDKNSMERDPGLQQQICEYPVNQRDEIRRAYIMVGPYQPILSKYPKSGPEAHPRSFQSSWFKLFPS